MVDQDSTADLLPLPTRDYTVTMVTLELIVAADRSAPGGPDERGWPRRPGSMGAAVISAAPGAFYSADRGVAQAGTPRGGPAGRWPSRAARRCPHPRAARLAGRGDPRGGWYGHGVAGHPSQR